MGPASVRVTKGPLISTLHVSELPWRLSMLMAAVDRMQARFKSFDIIAQLAAGTVSVAFMLVWHQFLVVACSFDAAMIGLNVGMAGSDVDMAGHLSLKTTVFADSNTELIMQSAP